MKKILITGSSGYVGYVLSKYFSEKKIPIIGVDVKSNPVWDGNKYFKFYKADVTDYDNFLDIFRKESPSHVIHLAFLMSPIHDEKRQQDIDINGSKNTMNAANKTSSVKQFIKFSSASAYGAWPDNKKWLKETDPLKPGDFRYGTNKKIVEKHLNEFDKRKDLNLIIIRMCTAIGPLYHKKGGVVSMLINSPFLIKPDGRYCEVQFIHENDLCALTELIINDKKIKGTYNLAPKDYSTTKKLVPDKLFLWIPLKLMSIILGMLWKLKLSDRMPAAARYSAYGIVIDPSKLIKRYGYKFKYTTLSGFSETVRKRKKLGTI
ncbi:NAD-dependent epimerase/dehydratase family protein [Candidatus Woesearchaeota archaeon]|nr:NAD-dependent epimerase/dehydratase family protein [Candidatus Woesearchaeota archaeon]